MDKKRLEELLDDMSMEEKIMQLVQLPGQAFEDDAAVTGITGGEATDRMKQLAGSTLGIFGSDKVIEIQKKYVENHPHHIPMLFMLDVIHGHKTVMPCPLAQGATFDPEVAKKGAKVQAKEAAADGVHVTFSPMVDLVRDARWGRVVESTGEDPYLNSLMSAAMVEGYQGDDLKDPEHMAACIKHFAGYGASEAGRDYNVAELSEYSLRDQYLKGYTGGINAGAKLVMTSFNTINGIPSSGNTYLMRDILRKEMGFDGVLISDWAAIAEMVSWGFAGDFKEAAELAMKAGVDIDMCTACYSDNLYELIASGKIDEKLLDEAVLRVLELKNDLGLFEDPYHGASADRFNKVTLTDENRAIARDAVRKSLVLLENKDGVLPLRDKNIALIGPYVDEKNVQSSWAISCDKDQNVTIREGFTKAYENTDTKLSFALGSELLDNDSNTGFNVFHSDSFEKDNEALLKEALEVAKKADTVVMCLGESAFQTGESTSKATIRIPEVQMNLLRKVSELGKKVVTLIFCGRPLEMEEIRDLSDAVLICWRPGTESGNGIADVLKGDASPSGKLPMSFPWTVGQEPIYYNRFMTGRPKPAEGLSIFTTRYLDAPNDPMYPFGYGLTYSEFEVSKVSLDTDKLSQEGSGKIIAKVTVTNKGGATATETLQLYIRDLCGSRIRPIKELKGFKKVTLEPGKAADVSFEINEEMLRFWSINNRFESEKGSFKVFIGLDSSTENCAPFELV